MHKTNLLVLVLTALIVCWGSCKKNDNGDQPAPTEEKKHLTIFTVNDFHSQLDNFAKIKYIVDREKTNTNVLVVSGGDNFSGNPIVDNHPNPGYPAINIMNEVGFDITVLGNHEFDYGIDALGYNMTQSNFEWVCANLDDHAALDHKAYKTFTIDDMNITFLGLIETEGKPGATIPLTHPWKVQELTFHQPKAIVSQYENLKEEQAADLYIALTHIGAWEDFSLAHGFPYFDMIIGGHSNSLVDTLVNGIPIFQAGYNLEYLGKISIAIEEKQIVDVDYENINLETYTNQDDALQQTIDQYNNSMPELDDVIGYASIHHYRYYNLGCFYTDALRIQMGVDVAFQNSGGIRHDLDEGDITKREIYAISPFKNGTIKYTMTVSEIIQFLKGSKSGLYYSGIDIEESGTDVIVKNTNGDILPENTILTVGINDYIPAVYDMYFPPPSSGEIQQHTAAETLILYLENNNQAVDYSDCSRYFKYDF